MMFLEIIFFGVGSYVGAVVAQDCPTAIPKLVGPKKVAEAYRNALEKFKTKKQLW